MLIDFASFESFFERKEEKKSNFLFWKREGVLEVIVEVGLLAGNALWAILLLRLSCFTGVDVFYRQIVFY